MGISPNRLVVLLTPLLFAPLAGTISALAAEHLPGVDIDPDQVQQIFIAGALIAFGKAALWLKGWQDWEKHEDVTGDLADDVGLEASMASDAETLAPDPDAALADEYEPDDEVDDTEDDDELAAPGLASAGMA